MDSTMSGGMSNDMIVGLISGGIMGIGIGVIVFIGLIWYVFQVVANWRIFGKFGEPGWKAIIPIYNEYIRYKATWNVKMFWIDLVLTVLLVVEVNVGSDTVIGVVYMILSWIVLIGLVILKIMKDFNMSRAFGHGAGFAAGLFFFDPIFKLVLAFGSSEYIGNPTTKTHIV